MQLYGCVACIVCIWLFMYFRMVTQFVVWGLLLGTLLALLLHVMTTKGLQTMKTAFAYWDNRIAPVFDIANTIRVVNSDNGRIVGESEETLDDGSPVRRVIDLAQRDIATLVCGAISRPLHGMIVSSGIQVIPFIAGDLGEVVQAWLDGTLEHERFAMPGCCPRGRRGRRGAYGDGGEEAAMNGGRGAKQGAGQGQGRMGGQTGGAIGLCVCTKCGHREPHERGVPCIQKRCPTCGTALTRE